MTWTYEVHELSGGLDAIVYDEHGQAIAMHLSEERARLIVRTVNAHDDLVTTLQDIAAMRWSVQSGDATARDMRGRARSVLRRIGRAKATQS